MRTEKELIWQFISAYHVVSITAQSNQQMWSANAFYIPDFGRDSIYIMSNTATRHARMMQQHPIISGTISDQVSDVGNLKGLQFAASAEEIADSEMIEKVQALYVARFPIAEKMQDTLWKISFLEMKYTDNSVGFGTKYIWKK